MGLKEQLDAAGYDTSSLNEADMLKKLDSAGYDTSKLQPAAPAKPGLPEDFFVDSAATKTVNNIGEKIATGLASKGFNPQVSAAAGTAFQMIPDVLMSGLGAEGPASAAKAIAESPVTKAFTPGGRQAVGEAIGALDKGAGIEQRIPTVSNFAKKLDLPARERAFADIVNSVKGKLESGEEIGVQELSDFRDLVKQQFGAGKIAKGTRLDALTSGTNKQAGQALNDLIPGRAKLSNDYNTIKQIQNGVKLLAKAGAGASGLGLSGLILKKLIRG